MEQDRLKELYEALRTIEDIMEELHKTHSANPAMQTAWVRYIELLTWLRIIAEEKTDA
jgi:hypothetical protein